MKDKPNKVRVDLMLSTGAREILREYARREGLSMSSAVEILIRKHADRNGMLPLGW